jgi:multidrug efflux pump subunit AcrA (membrane-fusion protein)
MQISNFLKFLVPILLGIAIIMGLVKTKELPQKQDLGEFSVVARVINIAPKSVKPMFKVHGVVKSSQTWEAIAEVSGKITEIHPQLRNGVTLKKGETLFRVDPTDYQLAQARLQSELSFFEAQLSEFDGISTNLKKSLDLEQKELALAARELERQYGLQAKKVASQSNVDKSHSSVLGKSQKLLLITNEISLLPFKRKKLEAQLQMAKIKYQEADRILKKTHIKLPFDARIGKVSLEKGQFVAVGQPLFSAFGVSLAEIHVQATLKQVKSIMPFNVLQNFPGLMGSSAFVKKLNIEADISLELDELEPHWTGKVTRFSEEIEATSGTIGLVVEIENPYEKMIPGKRPPLMQGMFVNVLIKSQADHQCLVLPRSAYNGKYLLSLSEDNRLQKLDLDLDFYFQDLVMLRTLPSKPNLRVIVSRVVPEVEGLLIQPIRDESFENKLNERFPGSGL